jgi:hypothetical protein
MVENSNQFGKLSIAEFGDFEKANHISLPNDYRSFLLEFNGGIPTPNKNLTPETVVAYLLGCTMEITTQVCINTLIFSKTEYR